ncbi:hypothetical protein VNO77_44011 [Canavalia gladiata]|uniref:Uncharacterized protein n=1 Tax=Canavalia gladiata TaxID=3824 RepID=A0AAN9JXS5_CANGL
MGVVVAYNGPVTGEHEGGSTKLEGLLVDLSPAMLVSIVSPSAGASIRGPDSKFVLYAQPSSNIFSTLVPSWQAQVSHIQEDIRTLMACTWSVSLRPLFLHHDLGFDGPFLLKTEHP